MEFQLHISVINPARGSIYCVLKAKLGREPSQAELIADVQRILAEGAEEIQERRSRHGLRR